MGSGAAIEMRSAAAAAPAAALAVVLGTSSAGATPYEPNPECSAPPIAAIAVVDSDAAATTAAETLWATRVELASQLTGDLAATAARLPSSQRETIAALEARLTVALAKAAIDLTSAPSFLVNLDEDTGEAIIEWIWPKRRVTFVVRRDGSGEWGATDVRKSLEDQDWGNLAEADIPSMLARMYV